MLQGVKSSTLGRAYYSVASGGTLVYVSAEQTTVFPIWVDRSGEYSAHRCATSVIFGGPRLSPDGSRLAMSANDALLETWILELGPWCLDPIHVRGQQPHTPMDARRSADWCFSSNREGGAHNLFWKPADGSGEPERLSTTDYHQDPASFSPDGKTARVLRRIIPKPSWTSGCFIWITNVGRNLFLRTKFDEHHPMIFARWSVACLHLERVRSVRGVRAVYPRWRQKMGHLDRGRQGAPVGAKRARNFFYRDRDRMMAVAVETEVVFAAERPRLLFDASGTRGPAGSGAPNFDVTRDGRHFVMMQRGEASAPKTTNQRCPQLVRGAQAAGADGGVTAKIRLHMVG